MRTVSGSPRCYVACAREYTNLALHAMYAHRLWITLGMPVVDPEENPSRPGGNAAVTSTGPRVVHTRPAGCARTDHSRCARPRRPLAARTAVIPGIHRPYDDYQFVIAGRSNPK
jgi:hypothetical protein